MPEIKDKVKKDKLTARERGALKRQDDEVKKAAIRRKSRQLNAIFRVIAVLGIVLSVIALLQDFYPSKQFSRSGISAAKDVVITGQVYVFKKSVREPFVLEKVKPIQMVLGIFPFLLAAFLVMYMIDFFAPLGISLQLFGMGFASVMMVLLMLMSGSAGIMKQGWWPGLQGPPVVMEMAALFVFFLGALTSVPGATRRLNEYLGIAEPVSALQGAGASATVQGAGKVAAFEASAEKVAVVERPAADVEVVKTATEADRIETATGVAPVRTEPAAAETPEKTSEAEETANEETPASGTPIVKSPDAEEAEKSEEESSEEKKTEG